MSTQAQLPFTTRIDDGPVPPPRPRSTAQSTSCPPQRRDVASPR